jgi:4-hydroxy-3-methylbut-2-enyl diphosphate reductase
MPSRGDLCFATTNRQAALQEVAEGAGTVIVIGSANSSNTMALTKVAEAAGCARVLRVNRASELPDDLEGVVAVTAGASAPESLVNEVLSVLNPSDGVTIKSVIVEDEYFPPPPELREMLKAISALADLVLQTPHSSQFDGQADREYTAAQVLASVSR